MEQQQMFLDTACFFIGQKRDTAIRIWEGSGWNGRLGLQTLENRCLLEVDIENNIDMHDHLRDFGKAVADASLPRRLLYSTAIKDMLEQLSNEQVSTVRGIRVVLGDYYDDVYASGGMDTLFDALDGIDRRTLELVDTDENAILACILRKPVPSLIWLRWNKCPNLSLPWWIPMGRLRVLQVYGSELKTLWEDESQVPWQVPLQLRELEINAPLSNIPKSIGWLEHLERIVVAGFLSGHVHLTKLPKEFCRLRSLRDLVLTECSKMKSLPDSFCHLWNLQHIDLSFCCNLERLPDSIGRLQGLRHINLSYCHDLERLPDSIGRLRGLQHIDLRGCHNLESLPDSFGELWDLPYSFGEPWDLRHINLSGCHDLQRLPDSFVNLRYLQHIDLQGCHNLQSLPDGFGDLRNLDHVNLSNCHDLEWLPDSFGNLRNLQYIDLSGCHNLERLPNYFRNFNKLKYLDVEGCSNLIIETIEITDNLPEAIKGIWNNYINWQSP
uniref:Disease resistance protein Roq1-like winged-helix domain-containing protein n=1 Tax=Picea sitchensis TaxID=3332 RepID=A9NW11_PICSI|nr:unknown [Picea sitchensis]